MRTRIAVLVAALATLLPGVASSEPQDAHLRWFQVANPGSCLKPTMLIDGDTFFDVNALPIPTWLQSTTGNLNSTAGRRTSISKAPFRTSILRVGSNTIAFYAENSSGDDSCNNNDNRITLHAPAFDDSGLFLFNVPMHGTAGAAVTEIELDLSQIDPKLAADIERLRSFIDAELEYMEGLGGDVDDAMRQRAKYEQLLSDLQELIDRGFDQIDPAELDALCAQYADIAEQVLEALKQVVDDFQTAIADLRAEIDRLSGSVSDRLGELDDFSANGPDFGDDDFASGDDGGLPDVDVPGAGDEPWDESNDVYDDYATETIALLTETLASDGTTVLERMRFLEIFNAWRRNIDAIELGLQSRAIVSQEEYGAFLQAKQRVVRFVEGWVDEYGWFRDSPVPSDVKELVQQALHTRNPEKAERMKLALNAMTEISNPEAAAIFGMLFALKELGIEVEAARAERLRQELAAKENSWWDSTVSFLGSVASVGWDIAVTVTPLGDLIDVCEAISGKAGCNLVSGRELSWKERAMSAVGMFMWGSTSSLRKLANKVDKIGCPLGAGFAPGVIYANPIACGAKRFFGKFESAMEAVQRKSPHADRLDGDPTRQGRELTYKAKNGPPVKPGARGVSVTYNKHGFVVFESRHLKAVLPPRQNEVWIDYLCHRTQEISDANAAAGFARGDKHGDAYTWHHSTNFRKNPSTGRVQIKMQLVNRDVHEFARHAGGHAIGKQIVGAANCVD